MLRACRTVGNQLKVFLAPSVLIASLAIASAPAWSAPPAQEVFSATSLVTGLGSQTITRFDISFVDPTLNLYLLADRTNKAVDVVDTTNNQVLIQLKSDLCPTAATPCPFAGFTGNNDTSGPDGVLTVGHEVWAGDGDSTIKVIDLLTHVTTHVINTGGTKRADELCLDPRDNLVLMANDADSPPFVTLISTVTYSVLKTIKMDGTNGTPKATNGIEQCQWSPSTGLFYVNIPEVNGPGDDTQPGAVLVISPETMTVVDTFDIPLGVCAGPQGMALGPENQILLGCNNPNHTVPSTVVINQRSGTVIHVLANEDGSDEVWFNEGDGHYFLAESAARPNQRLGVVDAQTGMEDPSATTGVAGAGGNHSVAADPVRNQVYVPIASSSGSTICGSLGGTNSQGCIAVFTTP